MDYKNLNNLKVLLKPFIGMNVNKLKLIVTPNSGSLLDTNVILSLSFLESNNMLTVATTGGQFPSVSNEDWEVDFIGKETLIAEMKKWKDDAFYENQNLKNQICFDLTEDTNVKGRKLTHVEIIVIKGGAPTGLKCILSNGQEIWTGPSNYGQNSVFITGVDFLNSHLTYPPNYIDKVEFIRIEN